jgi:hypothetical protein
MLELLNIFLSIFFFLIIFSYPVNIFNYKTIFISIKLKFFDLILLNVTFHLFFLLCLSFFKTNFSIIFFLDIILSLIFFLFNFRRYYLFLKKNLIIFILFIILCFSFFVTIAYNPLLSWDGFVHWIFKALNFYQGEGYSNLKNVPFSYYPHLGSFVWFYFWQGSVLQLEYFGRFFYPFLMLVTIFSIFDYLNDNYTISEKILLIIFFSFFCKDNFLFGGYQEYLVFVLLYIFAKFFILSNRCNVFLEKNILGLILLISNFLILWTKQEGFFYYLILNFIFILHSNNITRLKIVYFLFSLLLMLIYLILKIHFLGELNFNEPFLREDLLINFYPNVFLYKFLIITKYIFISFIKYPIWILIIFSIIYLNKKNYFYKNKFYLTFFFSTFILFYAIYFQTRMDISDLLPKTLSRLIFQISGFLLPLFIVFLNDLKVGNSKRKALL